MNIIDTCGWIEWVSAGRLAAKFSPYLNDVTRIITPTVIQHELYKWMARERSKIDALKTYAVTASTAVTPLNSNIALFSANLSREHKLAMADAIIYATALYHGAILVTCDDHFEGLPNVVYFSKKKVAA